jgi:uncharacterized protein (TIGR02246 family)
LIEPTDDSAIRNLVATYADAVGARDLDAWQNTWSPDGVWHVGNTVLQGKDDIVGFMSGALERFSNLLQTVFSGIVTERDGGGIYGTWHVLEVQHVSETDERLVIGRYDDVYTKRDGHWVFAERRFTPLYRGPAVPGMEAR